MATEAGTTTQRAGADEHLAIAVVDVIDAYTPGPVMPWLTRARRDRLHAAWPELARSLDRLTHLLDTSTEHPQ